jgi:sec-independent protein translocase protein TatC
MKTLIFMPVAYVSFYVYGNSCVVRLSSPLEILYKNPSFLSTDLTEIFYTKLLLAAILSVVCGAWLTLAQTYIFISPGLIRYNSLRIFLTVTLLTISSYLCAHFVMNVIFPSFLYFLDAMRENPFTYLNYTNFEGNLKNYLLSILPIIFIISFLLIFPFILFLLIYYKILNFAFIIKYRQSFYFVVVFIGTIFSAPDLTGLLVLLTTLFNLIELYLFFYYNVK